jgi:hypothetical protein
MNTLIPTAIPILSGVVVLYLAFMLDDSRFQVRGIVGPYFGTIAILFGLFASLTAHESWQRIAKINGMVSIEAEALNGIHEVGIELDKGAEVKTLILEYIEGERDHQASYADSGLHIVKSSEAIHSLYALGFQEDFFEGKPLAIQGYFFRLLDNLRTARLERQEIYKRHLSGTKVLALLILGVLTQTAIALCHAGQVRASIAGVMLFSLAFAVSIYFITMFDHPETLSRMIDMETYRSALR